MTPAVSAAVAHLARIVLQAGGHGSSHRRDGTASGPDTVCPPVAPLPVAPLHDVASFAGYLARRRLSTAAVAALPPLDHALLAQRCLTYAHEHNDGAAVTELDAWCRRLVGTPPPPTAFNTPELRAHVALKLPNSRRLVDHLSTPSCTDDVTRSAEIFARAPAGITTDQPSGTALTEPLRALAHEGPSPSVGGGLAVLRADGPLCRVDDPAVLCLRTAVQLPGGDVRMGCTETAKRGPEEGGALPGPLGRQFSVVAAAAMVKGSGQPPTPKAMGEDAHVIDVVEVEVGGTTVSVPFVAALDGGGGHQLAQYGQAHLASTFAARLQEGCDELGMLDSYVLCTAMRQADDQLFGRLDLVGSPSEGYTAVLAGHAAATEATGLAAGEFVRICAQHGPMSGLNPAQAHRRILRERERERDGDSVGGNPDLQSDARGWVVTTPRRTFDLADPTAAAELQSLFELATGTVIRMEVQLVMSCFHALDEGHVGVTTYNRGDCQAIATDGVTGLLTSLSTPVSGLATNCSHAVLPRGSRVTAGCDGHFEKLSLEDHEAFDRAVSAVVDTTMCCAAEAGATERYVERLVQASVWIGGGDDITIVSARLL